MNKFTAWTKANPIAVVSALVALVALVALGVMMYLWEGELRAAMTQRGKAFTELSSMERTRVSLPPIDPLGQPREELVTINAAGIEDLKAVYGGMKSQYNDISRQLVERNQAGHSFMIDRLFPQAGGAEKVEAKRVYRTLLSSMLDDYSPQAAGTDSPMPRLDAGPPVSLDEINLLLQETTASFLKNRANPPVADVASLPPAQYERLKKTLRDVVARKFSDHASSIHLYAQTDITRPLYPLDVLSWSSPDVADLPTMEQLWEGQMNLWIQQDLAHAIAMANRFDQPGSSVLTAPVKRLVEIKVLDGYVGINTAGAISGGAVTSVVPATSVTSALPQNYLLTPTGRYSNAIYDVRQVHLVVVVDVKQMPRLFDNLGKINLMTILRVDMKNVDEYEALSQGFVYGSADVVELDMLIETIWFRAWMLPQMPEDVKKILQIIPGAPAPSIRVE